MNDEAHLQMQRKRQAQEQAQVRVQMGMGRPALADGERAAEERQGCSSSPSSPRARPDYLLVSCLVLIYLELSWLILMLLRTYSRH